jgi:hypothetical protein
MRDEAGPVVTEKPRPLDQLDMLDTCHGDGHIRRVFADYSLTDKLFADLFIKFFPAIKAVVNEVIMFFACSCFNIAGLVLERFFMDLLDFGNNVGLLDSRTPALFT